jgi:hypothetical protein
MRAAALAARLEGRPEQPYLLALLARDAGDEAQAMQRLEAGLARWPDSALLRYASLDRAWGAMAFGRADADTLRSASLLTGHAALVRDAARAEAAGRWDKVRALDPQLAAVPATALPYAQAVLLRADWRAVSGAGDPARLSAEALRWIDAAILVTPTARLLAVRIWLLAAAGRDGEATEAIDDYALAVLERAAVIDAGERQRSLNDLRGMRQLLDSPGRAAVARESVDRALASLQAPQP